MGRFGGGGITGVGAGGGYGGWDVGHWRLASGPSDRRRSVPIFWRGPMGLPGGAVCESGGPRPVVKRLACDSTPRRGARVRGQGRRDSGAGRRRGYAGAGGSRVLSSAQTGPGLSGSRSESRGPGRSGSVAGGLGGPDPSSARPGPLPSHPITLINPSPRPTHPSFRPNPTRPRPARRCFAAA